MTAKDHNKLIGIFHLIQGGLQAFTGLLIGIVYGVLGIAFAANARHESEQMMGTVFIVLAIVVGLVLLAFAGLNLMAGYKMIKEKAGARTWAIIASIACIWSIPIGTALGIYGLWFLFGDEGKRYYLGQTEAPQYAFPPPPPNNWQ